jgi:hypothetical protein
MSAYATVSALADGNIALTVVGRDDSVADVVLTPEDTAGLLTQLRLGVVLSLGGVESVSIREYAEDV